jgi:peroxiredoxin
LPSREKKRAIIIFLILLPLTFSCARRDLTGSAAGRDGFLLFESVDVNSGIKISLGDLLGEDRVVLLNFWGVKCLPCLEELKALNHLYYERLKGSRITIIAVNTDGLQSDTLKEMMEKNDIRIIFSVIADPEMEITNYYTDGFIPHNVVITKEGGREIEIIGYNEKLYYKLKNKLFELAGERPDRSMD